MNLQYVKKNGECSSRVPLFVVSSLLLCKLAGQKPYAQAATNFQLLTALNGIVFSFLSGLVVPLIVKNKTLTLNYMLGLIIAGFACFSLVKSDGSHWTQLLAMFIFAPVSLVGGLVWLK